MLYEMCTFLPFNNVPVVYIYFVIKKLYKFEEQCKLLKNK